METGTLIDNGGNEVTYIKRLKKGDELICKKQVRTLGDIGFSGKVYDCEAFIVGKIYTVHHIYNWGGSQVAYVADEDNTLHFAIPEIFDIHKII